MTEYVQVWRAKVAGADVAPLLNVRPSAIEEAKRLCPELVRAELVNAGGGVSLDMLTWSVADGEESSPPSSTAAWATSIRRSHRFDRFSAPAASWDELQERFPDLLGAG